MRDKVEQVKVLMEAMKHKCFCGQGAIGRCSRCFAWRCDDHLGVDIDKEDVLERGITVCCGDAECKLVVSA